MPWSHWAGWGCPFYRSASRPEPVDIVLNGASSHSEARTNQPNVSNCCLWFPDSADRPTRSSRPAGPRRSTTGCPSSSSSRKCRLSAHHLAGACSVLPFLASRHHTGAAAGPARSDEVARCSGERENIDPHQVTSCLPGARRLRRHSSNRQRED